MKPIDAEELFAAMEQALMPMLPSAPAAAPLHPRAAGERGGPAIIC